MDQLLPDDIPPVEKMLDKPVTGAPRLVIGETIMQVIDKGVSSDGWHKYVIVTQTDGLIDSQFGYLPPEVKWTDSGAGLPESVNSILHRMFGRV